MNNEYSTSLDNHKVMVIGFQKAANGAVLFASAKVSKPSSHLSQPFFIFLQLQSFRKCKSKQKSKRKYCRWVSMRFCNGHKTVLIHNAKQPGGKRSEHLEKVTFFSTEPWSGTTHSYYRQAILAACPMSFACCHNEE